MGIYRWYTCHTDDRGDYHCKNKGEYNNGIYTVNAKVFYGDTCSDTCGPSSEFYSSYSDSLNRVNAIVELQGQEFTEEVAAQYRDKLPTSVYKFKKNSSNNIVLFEVDFQ